MSSPDSETVVFRCAKCGGAVEGWKCAICGVENMEFDTGHLHEDSDRYMCPKCTACGQADVLCACE